VEGRRCLGETLSLRVLCLDIEGGYGGSSRSLYELVRHLPAEVAVEVWCRRQGPIQQRYAALGIPCRVTADMPHISSLPRVSRNLYAYGRFLLRWKAGLPFRRALASAASRFDVVHFNHEGLFLLARWLHRQRSRRKAAALTAHVRTCLPPSAFSRWQFRALAGAVDRLAFITENERRRAELLSGTSLDGDVIYNVAAPPPVAAHADLAVDPRFKVAALGNYAFVRGIDRLVDVAAEIKGRDRSSGIVFVVAGNMALPRSLPGLLGEVGRRGGDLADYAAAKGVAGMFRFLGHVSEPEAVLAGCDMAVRPSRQGDPWGRDVIEAMAQARPVLATGSYSRFVETGVTGLLHGEFDPSQWADDILALAEDPSRVRMLGQAAQWRVLSLCDGPARAADLARLWKDANRCAA
jgi:glycosyltransferase involved in cell wall biosynthesis